MLIVTLKDNTRKYFSFPNIERERTFRNAWYAMSDMSKYSEKVLKITTSDGEETSYKISDIIDCAVIQ